MNIESNHLVQSIKAMIFDVDGVLTDNRISFNKVDGSTRIRSYYDGQGISLLRAIGIHVCFITNEKGEAVNGLSEFIDKLNALPSSKGESNPNGWPLIDLYVGMGGFGKIEAAEEFLKDLNISFNEVGFMGDDLVDAALLEKVAFRASPISGEDSIKRMCHFISSRPGGYGAIRDRANFILEIRGIDPLSLPYS